ncbi:hypothetical protein FRIGORI9N_420109 [Frigoribacterium sp. 9N]|nr:hypothetical protein FRIGORI9N_420109 [Frigoribacterium sp. 9N]
MGRHREGEGHADLRPRRRRAAALRRPGGDGHGPHLPDRGPAPRQDDLAVRLARLGRHAPPAAPGPPPSEVGRPRHRRLGPHPHRQQHGGAVPGHPRAPLRADPGRRQADRRDQPGRLRAGHGRRRRRRQETPQEEGRGRHLQPRPGAARGHPTDLVGHQGRRPHRPAPCLVARHGRVHGAARLGRRHGARRDRDARPGRLTRASSARRDAETVDPRPHRAGVDRRPDAPVRADVPPSFTFRSPGQATVVNPSP